MTSLNNRYPDLLDGPDRADLESLVADLDQLGRMVMSQRMSPERDAVIARMLHEQAVAGGAASGRPTTPRRLSVWMPARRHWLPARVGAILAVAMLLMGAGMAGGYLFGGPFGWLSKPQAIGNQRLYTNINQSQTDQGITITVRQAYADTGSTLLYYSIQVTPQLAQRYDESIDMGFALTDQFGDTPQNTDHGPIGDRRCTALSSIGEVECLQDFAPFHVSKNVTQLTITFDVGLVGLAHSGSAAVAYVQGRWSFQFTIPFYQNNLGPSEAAPGCGNGVPCVCVHCRTPLPGIPGTTPQEGKQP
jgi:hypothetical protein